MADIFISYSRSDSAKADQLESQLQQAGFSTWIDREGLYGGQTWQGELATAIRNCEVFLLLLSGRSAVSRYVQQELLFASELRKGILPIELEPSNLPDVVSFALSGVQRVPYSDSVRINQSVAKILQKGTGILSINKILIESVEPERGGLHDIGVQDRLDGSRDQNLLESWNASQLLIRRNSRSYINGFYHPIFAEGDDEEFFEVQIQGNGTSAALVKTRPNSVQEVYVTVVLQLNEGDSNQILDGHGRFHFRDMATLRGGASGGGFRISSEAFRNSPTDVWIAAEGLEDACRKFFARFGTSNWRILPDDFYSFVYPRLRSMHNSAMRSS